MKSVVPITSTLEFARGLQLEMLDLPFDKRTEFAVGALKALRACRQRGKPFLVEAQRAYLRPAEAFSEQNRLITFDKVAIEGILNGFTYMSVGNIAGMPLNSLCASFYDVKFLPGGDRIGEDHIMHIPALAIDCRMQLAS